MTVDQEATIAKDALYAAREAPVQGPSGRLSEADISRAMVAFWVYVRSVGATGNSKLQIPLR